MDVAGLVVTSAVGEDTLCDLKEIQRLCAACVASRSEMVARRLSSSGGTGSARGASLNLNSVVDNQWRVAQDPKRQHRRIYGTSIHQRPTS